jgi:hypothetical protein
MISRNVGFPSAADKSRSVHELGTNEGPLEESVADMFQQIIDMASSKCPDPS